MYMPTWWMERGRTRPQPAWRRAPRPPGAGDRPGRGRRGRPRPPAPVDAVGREELAEGRGRPARCRSSRAACRAASGPRAGGGGRPGPACGSPPARPGFGRGSRGLVVVLDQASTLAFIRSMAAWTRPPRPAGVLGVDAAEGDAEQDTGDEEMPKRAQGEVPFAWGVCGRAGTLSRRVRRRRWRRQFRCGPARGRPELPGRFRQEELDRVPRALRPRRRTMSSRRLISSTRSRRAASR